MAGKPKTWGVSAYDYWRCPKCGTKRRGPKCPLDDTPREQGKPAGRL